LRIRGWLTGLIIFLLAPSLLFASLWFHNKFENVRATDRSLTGIQLIQALGPLVQEKAVTGQIERVPPGLRQELRNFGGAEQADQLSRTFDIFVNEPDLKTSLGYAQELSETISDLARVDASVSHESSTLPHLINAMLFSVVIESSKMVDNGRKLAKREKINKWEKMLVPVQGGKFKAAADGTALKTNEYFKHLSGPNAEDLRQKADDFRNASFAFQSAGSKLLSSTIMARTGSNIVVTPVIEAHPALVDATFMLWQSSLDYLIDELLRTQSTTQFDVALAGLLSGLVILAAFVIAVVLSRALAERTQQVFENLGFHDPLTGLPNRRALLKCIRTLPEAHADTRVGLLIIDLRHFKKINDRFGDHNGDSILREVAEQLTQLAGPDDLVSRTGGTEFMLLRRRLKSPLDFEHLAAKLIHELGRDRYLDGHKATIESNAGLFVSRSGGEVNDQMLVDAALALRSAKQKGTRKYALFTPDMRAAFEENGEIAKELLKALSEGDIMPWYQPQVDIHTGEVVGAEALVRWIDHDTVRYPGSFLPAAVEAGYMDLIEKTVREHALRLAANLNGKTRRPIHLGLNVSADLLSSAGAVDALDRQVRDMGLLPFNVSLEILEAVMIDENTATPIKENIARLSELGFFIELDDFGTGHSSISSLRDLKVDRVKIDRSFISGVDKDPDLQKFTSALINLAKSLDICVLAEGVETEGERTWLRRNGCDVIQGFLISKAVPEDQLAALILKHNFVLPLAAPALRNVVLGHTR